MKKHDLITGVVVGSAIGVFYAVQLTPYMPLLVIGGIVLFLKLLPIK